MAEPLSLGAALGISGGLGLLNSGLQFLGGNYSQSKQIAAQKDLFDYIWDKANSPQAQVKNLTASGLNPVGMLGSHGLSEIGSPSGQISPIDYQGIGTTDLTGLAQYIAATADAKKKGVEIPGIEADTQGKLLDNERKTFENDLLKMYGNSKMAAEVSLAWQNYALALQSEDLNKQEIAKKQWEVAKEQALSQVAENQRDILKKELDNKDTEIALRNEQKREEIKTEKSKQSANYASAQESSSAAALNAERVNTERTVQKINRFLADIKEGERNFNQATFDTRFRKMLSDLESSELSALSDKIRLSDLEAYNAFQRILLGKTQHGDANKVWQTLHDLDKTTRLHAAQPK